MGDWRYNSISYLSGHWMEVVDQLHASVALPPGKSSPIPVTTQWETVRNPALLSLCLCVCVCIHIYRPACVYNSNQHAAFAGGLSATDI